MLLCLPETDISIIMQMAQPRLASRLSVLPDRVALPLRCDPGPLATEAAAFAAEIWTRHFVPDNYRGDWSVLPLRAPQGAIHPILQITSPPDCWEWVDTPHLAACPAIAAALGQLECVVHAARLMKLGPGSEILEHRDHDLSAECGMARLHLPLSTNAQVEFRVNGAMVDMQPGQWWYLRLSDPHAVQNRGSSDRIHLVVDVQVNDWLTNLLCKAAT